MTTAPPLQSKSKKPSSPELAINGGPRAVSESARERWKSVRLGDAIPILKAIYKGRTSIPTGPAIRAFERDFARLCGVEHAIVMNSGTAALHSAMFAVGVGPGDEVILPSYTWHASASSVRCCGANPVFCDIDPVTLTADPDDIAQRITDRTKAVMVVHVWGNPAEMDKISDLTRQHGVALIEDCSHAHGASYQGKSVGAWGDVGCFSLQGGKAVSAGEGGVAVCHDPNLYDRMMALGQPVRVASDLKANDFDLVQMNLGPKHRPHLFGVLLASSSLTRLSRLNELRTRNWTILCEELAGATGIAPVTTLPSAKRGGYLEFKLILAPGIDREAFIEAARAEGLRVTEDRYGALHKAPIFASNQPITLADLSRRLDAGGEIPALPNTESLQGRVVTLPPYTDVSTKFMRQCGQALKKVAAAFGGMH